MITTNKKEKANHYVNQQLKVKNDQLKEKDNAIKTLRKLLMSANIEVIVKRQKLESIWGELQRVKDELKNSQADNLKLKGVLALIELG